MLGYLPRLFGDIFVDDLDGKGKQFLYSIWRVMQARMERKMSQESSPFVEADALDMLHRMMDVLRQLEEGYGGKAKRLEVEEKFEEKFKAAADYIGNTLEHANKLVGLAMKKKAPIQIITVTEDEYNAQCLYRSFAKLLSCLGETLDIKTPQKNPTYEESGKISLGGINAELYEKLNNVNNVKDNPR
jgi:hypothetical protein